MIIFHRNYCCCVTTVSVCMLSSKMCAGPMQRPVRAGPCCPAGTLTVKRAAVLSLSTAAVGATGITLSQRSTAYLSAAASVSPAGSSTCFPLTLTGCQNINKLLKVLFKTPVPLLIFVFFYSPLVCSLSHTSGLYLKYLLLRCFILLCK